MRTGWQRGTSSATDEARAALEGWYRSKLGLVDARVTEFAAPNSGAVNDTFLHTVVFTKHGESVTLSNVLRPQPVGETPIPGVDVRDQARTLQALSSVKHVPAPEVLWVEEDPVWLQRPFFIMGRLEGEPIFEDGTNPTDSGSLGHLFEQAITVLVNIHEVDWEHAGFEHLASKNEGRSPLPFQLETYRQHLDRSAEGKRYPQLEAALEWLLANVPSSLPSVLNWGDARVGNLLFDDLRLSAVLDWEMAEIAPREVDVGWFVYLERFFWTDGQRSRPGGPTGQDIVKMYEERAGVKLHDLMFFERWAAFRLAVMRMRAGRQMIARGLEPESSRIDEINLASTEMAKLFEFSGV